VLIVAYSTSFTLSVIINVFARMRLYYYYFLFLMNRVEYYCSTKEMRFCFYNSLDKRGTLLYPSVVQHLRNSTSSHDMSSLVGLSTYVLHLHRRELNKACFYIINQLSKDPLAGTRRLQSRELGGSRIILEGDSLVVVSDAHLLGIIRPNDENFSFGPSSMSRSFELY
jgi:hypothetical protein